MNSSFPKINGSDPLMQKKRRGNFLRYYFKSESAAQLWIGLVKKLLVILDY